jgi:hypothetical protein
MLLSALVPAACSEATPDRTTETAEPSVTGAAETTLQSGWSRFAIDGFEFGLPERFEGGDILALTRALEEAGGQAGVSQQVRAGITAIRQNDAIELYAFDGEAASDSYATNVTVLKAPALGGTAEQQLRQVTAYYETEVTGLTIVEGRVLDVAGRATAHLIIDSEFPFGTVRQFHYYVPEGDTIWFVNYAAAAAEARDWQPVIEESAATILVT